MGAKGSTRRAGMSSVDFVEDAAQKVRWLQHREMRGPGDLEGAMHRIEARYGIPYGAQWALRYRKPRDILVSVYAAVIAAHEAEHDRQVRLLAHERSITKAKTGLAAYLVRAAASVVGEKDQ
jgi:hypothetical protein